MPVRAPRPSPASRPPPNRSHPRRSRSRSRPSPPLWPTRAPRSPRPDSADRDRLGQRRAQRARRAFPLEFLQHEPGGQGDIGAPDDDRDVERQQPVVGERSALGEGRARGEEDRHRTGEGVPGQPARNHRLRPGVLQLHDAGRHHFDREVDPAEQEREPGPVVPGLDDIGPGLRPVGGHDPRAAIEEDDQRDEDPAHRRGERPEWVAPLDLRQHDAERDRARGEQAGGDVEHRAPGDHAPMVVPGVPLLGLVSSQIRMRGKNEVGDAQPPHRGQPHEHEVAPQADLLTRVRALVLHGGPPRRRCRPGQYCLIPKYSADRSSMSTTSEHRSRLPGADGLWVFIGFDAVIFALLFASFQHDRYGDPALFEASRRTLNFHLAGLDTLLLLTSSWLVALAVQAVARDDPRAPRLLLGGMLTGAMFVVSKSVEYAEKLIDGITPATDALYGWYFLLTGVHLAHVLAGTGLLGYTWRRSRRGAYRDGNRVVLECVASFWHLVDLLWLVLFPLLYLQR